MSFQPVLLTTDVLIFLLVASVLGLVWYIRRHAHLRAPWARVARNPVAMGSAMILLVFVVIALLDSLHYRPRLPGGDPNQPQYGVEVLSAFDALVPKLRTQQEKPIRPRSRCIYTRRSSLIAAACKCANIRA